MTRRSIAVVALGIAVLTGPTRAETITGPGTVVDSDVIEIGGQRVMLFGLESLERNQSCRIDGEPWACYAAAVRHLETLVSFGDLTCETVGNPDIYGRHLARCMIGDDDLNETFVSSGFAVARPDETTDYMAAENAAKKAGLGLWKGSFQRPTDYRFAVGIFVDRP